MTPYEHLAHHYDSLFRLNPQIVAFLERELGGFEGRRLVDAGCGTGTLARALADRGAWVLAVDLDEALLPLAHRKAQQPPSFLVQRGDIRDFACEGGLNALLCLGNTLPHLPDEASVRTFFRHAIQLLRPGGLLLVQVVNYDRVLDQDAWELPVLQAGTVQLHRDYQPIPGGRLLFRTRLEAPEGSTASEHPLLPIRSTELDAAARAAGWSEIHLLGDWEGAPFSVGAPALVLKGVRKQAAGVMDSGIEP